MPHPIVAQTGVLDLISQAGIVAKFVLLLLFAVSVLCWAIIISKWKTLELVMKQNERFLTLFWSGKNLDEIVSKSEHLLHSPNAAAFRVAIKELRKFSNAENPASSTHKADNIQRSLTRSSVQEIAQLEKNLGWLASTASTAPFVGLFGTVWGIMNSFQNIGASGAANLAIVAPGISEALITTATGIAAAIPAVIAYNYFSSRIKKVAIDLDCFSQDFMNIVQRSFLNSEKEK